MRYPAFVAAAVAALALAAPAAAAEPTREAFTLHRVINPFVVCPGFKVAATFDITRETTTFFDRDGTPVMRIVRNEIVGTLTNPLTGSSLTTSGIRIFHYDLVTGELFTTGSNNVTQLPGGGVSIPGAGRLVFDASGHLVEHDGPTSAEELAQVCAALAG